jgi:hypothetical protein
MEAVVLGIIILLCIRKFIILYASEDEKKDCEQ